ncbi:DUF4296 domain-containing protein [Bizionia argentinensis JUB59]|uniref:DUF4296 domain-containing protein n=1 Tax=Bizionia argentinensis JUB59 TaxID=1046627 RepID=G2EHG6_9FLAO|nr:DUF4296 domain-containing protein [Bizionia argentinensis]EGV42142.2 DUF4296 domain-containing protein [Bizionia argentinensis JUB59]
MKKVVVYSLLTLILVGCNPFSKPKKPKNLITKNDMVSILVDLSILSSAKGINKKILETNGISPEAYVYKTHNIDSLQFLNSNKYYSWYTEDYSLIIDRVEDSLNKLKVKYNTQFEENLIKEREAKQIIADSVGKEASEIKGTKAP